MMIPRPNPKNNGTMENDAAVDVQAFIVSNESLIKKLEIALENRDIVDAVNIMTTVRDLANISFDDTVRAAHALRTERFNK